MRGIMSYSCTKRWRVGRKPMEGIISSLPSLIKTAKWMIKEAHKRAKDGENIRVIVKVEKDCDHPWDQIFEYPQGYCGLCEQNI